MREGTKRTPTFCLGKEEDKRDVHDSNKILEPCGCGWVLHVEAQANSPLGADQTRTSNMKGVGEEGRGELNVLLLNDIHHKGFLEENVNHLLP
jgi:hypothetical protein